MSEAHFHGQAVQIVLHEQAYPNIDTSEFSFAQLEFSKLELLFVDTAYELNCEVGDIFDFTKSREKFGKLLALATEIQRRGYMPLAGIDNGELFAKVEFMMTEDRELN